VKKFLHEKEFVHLGFIRKAVGYKGEVRLSIEEIYEEDAMASDFIFIELDGLKVPFKVESIENANTINVKFEKVDDSNDSEKLSGKQIYLLFEDLKHAKENIKEKEIINEFVGFEIKDSNTNFLVKISEIREYPQQIMAVVRNNDKEILIPLNDQFIKEIERNEKVIHMDLPDGLLDL